ncbi:MAG: FecR domain-containing protein [Opitutaceae bacterium]|nr:FecR domain-containing protein [Opitutaceae bacterium]
MNPGSNPPSPDLKTAEHEAAAWTLRIRNGLRNEDHRGFEAWLKRDPRHASILAEMNETSRLLDRLRDPSLAPADAPCVEIPFDIDATHATRRRRWLAPLSLAAAAILAIVGILSLNLPVTGDNYSRAFATAAGASQTVQLPDGSVLRLNTDSAVVADYTAKERRIHLTRGEAFFSVAKNPQRPFWVDAGTISVRAVGTEFNVRFRPESIEVLVKEGKVSVNPSPVKPSISAPDSSAPAHMIVAGEQATVSLPPKHANEQPQVVVAPMDAQRMESALAWQQGRLEFTDTPLAEVVAEFNRYNRHQLAIGDPSLRSEPFGGTFAPQGYEAFLEVLEQGFGIVGERHGNKTILRRKAASLQSN